jgi:citrate synthase
MRSGLNPRSYIFKIGKATVWRSAICKSNEDTVVVRVADLSEDLIVHLNFGDYFYLLLTGKRADTGLI